MEPFLSIVLTTNSSNRFSKRESTELRREDFTSRRKDFTTFSERREGEFKPDPFTDALITPINELLLKENLYSAFLKYSAVYYSIGWLLIKFEGLWYFLELFQHTQKPPNIPVTAKLQFRTLQSFFGFNNEVKSLYDVLGAHFLSETGDEYLYSHSFFAICHQFIEFDDGSYIPDPALPRALVENAKYIIDRVFPGTAPSIREKDQTTVDKRIYPNEKPERLSEL